MKLTSTCGFACKPNNRNRNRKIIFKDKVMNTILVSFSFSLVVLHLGAAVILQVLYLCKEGSGRAETALIHPVKSHSKWLWSWLITAKQHKNVAWFPSKRLRMRFLTLPPHQALGLSEVYCIPACVLQCCQSNLVQLYSRGFSKGCSHNGTLKNASLPVGRESTDVSILMEGRH